MNYQWDDAKARANLRKHGIDFADDAALTIREDHPNEERFITVGMDAFGRILVVVYTWRGEEIRLISARKATPRERKEYEGSK